MREGERQVAPTLDGIRRDHVARYEFVAKRLQPNSNVIDFACGVGYGSNIIAKAGHFVRGCDIDDEALEYARTHYAHERALFENRDADAPGESLLNYHAAVCFETIEHVVDPRPLLRALREWAPVLYASVPNEDVMPFQFGPGRFYAFHHRHYTKQQFEELLAECGWRVTEWYGQVDRHSEVEPNVNGRTLIVVAKRIDEIKDRPGKSSKHVSIVGLGPSCSVFFELTRRLGGASAYCDEVWGINAMGDVLRCDRVFHMDDVLIQEARAREKPEGNIAAMTRWLKTHPGPIYTSVVRDGYPGMVAFPLEDVLNGGYDTNGGAPYFNSTAAYAIAYAIHTGVKRISLFGLDYTMPNAHKAEQGRACCEFWLGIAAARGIEITVTDQSSMLDACEDDRSRLYGYDCVDVSLRDMDDGSVRVQFDPRKDIPSAAEIEARYDHAKHPNPLLKD